MAEVLLALIIEDLPERDYGSDRFEMDLGLEYPNDAYPTGFWNSTFLPFLQLAPETALTSLILLVNFCTERWAAEGMEQRTGDASELHCNSRTCRIKLSPSWLQVFG